MRAPESGGSPSSTSRARPTATTRSSRPRRRGSSAISRLHAPPSCGRRSSRPPRRRRRSAWRRRSATLEQRLKRAERGAERDEVLLAIDVLGSWYRDLVVVGAGAESAALNSDRLAELTEDAPEVNERAARARARRCARSGARSSSTSRRGSRSRRSSSGFGRSWRDAGRSASSSLRAGASTRSTRTGSSFAWNARVICETAYGQEFARVVKANHDARGEAAVAVPQDRPARDRGRPRPVEVRKAESRRCHARFPRGAEAAQCRGEARLRGDRLRRLAHGLLVPVGRAHAARGGREGARPPARWPRGAALGRPARVRPPLRRRRPLRRGQCSRRYPSHEQPITLRMAKDQDAAGRARAASPASADGCAAASRSSTRRTRASVTARRGSAAGSRRRRAWAS